jgi:curved DNA-binding protein CbpA
VPLSPEQKDAIKAEDDKEMKAAREQVDSAFEKEKPQKSRSYYEELGVDKNASQVDIKKAYLDRAKETHPDFHPDDPDAKKKFQAVAAAFECLSDPEKRKIYDDIEKSLKAEADQETPGIKSSKNELMLKMGVSEEQLPAIVEKSFGGEKGALVNFVYEVETQGGALQELTGDLKRDAKKIEGFFDQYGIHVDKPTIENIGAGIYAGAVKERKKRDSGLLGIFFNMMNSFNRDVERLVGKRG